VRVWEEEPDAALTAMDLLGWMRKPLNTPGSGAGDEFWAAQGGGDPDAGDDGRPGSA
jgi:hypothetical protein